MCQSRLGESIDDWPRFHKLRVEIRRVINKKVEDDFHSQDMSPINEGVQHLSLTRTPEPFWSSIQEFHG